MEKIVIIGGNGSGKTTFAGQLSKKLDIPLISIDKIYWSDNWTRADEHTANILLKAAKYKKASGLLMAITPPLYLTD